MQQLKNLRKQKGVTQKDIAEYLGCTVQTVANYENGRRSADYETQLKLAEYFNVSLDYLLRGYGMPNAVSSTEPIATNIIPLPTMVELPLLGTIACGEPILAVENVERMVSAPQGINADFALMCKGDSMINARIFDGDVVYIKSQPDVDDGTIAAVLIGEEATLKRVYKYPNKLVLRACNPVYDDLIYTDSELDCIRILGKAVAFLSAVR